MLKLIKLEMKKYKLGWYFKGAIIANILIVALMTSLFYITRLEGDEFIQNQDQLFGLLGTMVRATFIVMASVIISKLVINEYNNKTIQVMFTYPINRKKIFAAKLLITAILTFVTIIVSNLFVSAAVYVLNDYLQFVPISLTKEIIIKEVLSIIVFAFGVSGTSIIPLYFGMRKKSVPGTILSSFIIVAIICSENPAFSLASIVYIPLAFAVVGITIAAWSIRNVENADLV